jgi:carbon starvation protein CstA
MKTHHVVNVVEVVIAHALKHQNEPHVRSNDVIVVWVVSGYYKILSQFKHKNASIIKSSSLLVVIFGSYVIEGTAKPTRRRSHFDHLVL